MSVPNFLQRVGGHKSSLAAVRFHNTGHLQRFDRLTNGATAHLKKLRQLHFALNPVSLFPCSLLDLATDLRGNIFVNPILLYRSDHNDTYAFINDKSYYMA